MMGRYRNSKITDVVTQCTSGINDDVISDDGAVHAGTTKRDSFNTAGGASPTAKNNKSPKKSKYQALLDDDDGSESSGESLGIRIPQGYLSANMSSSSLDVKKTSSSPSSSPNSKNKRRSGSSSSGLGSSSKKKNEGSMLLNNVSGSFSPRTEPNEEDLRRLVAMAKHPNPMAAERALAASNPMVEPRRRRSSGSSSSSRKRSSHLRRSGSLEDDRSNSSNQSSASTAVNTGAWLRGGEQDSAAISYSSSDDSGLSGSDAAVATFAANLGSRSQGEQGQRSISTESTYSTEEEDNDLKTSHPSVKWEDQQGHHYGEFQGDDMERAPPPQPNSPVARRRRGGVLEWMSVLFAPAGADSALNTTDSSLASKEGHSIGVSVSSEKTPKISNLSPTNWNKEQDDLEAGSGSIGGAGGRKFKNLFARKSTVAIAVLSVILVVALATTITAAVYASDRRDDKENNGSTQFSSNTMIPRPPTYTVAPTIKQPTASPSTSVPTTNAPTLDPASPTAAPVITPNPTLRPTRKPTIRPTPAPTSKFISPPVSTPNPTRKPTPSPTKKPTVPPTMKPTSPKPTSSPTRSPQPTSAPTTAFLGSELNSLGNPLEGSEPGERYGYSVAVSDDGTIMAVGAPYATNNEGNLRAGMVQVYEFRQNSVWEPRGEALYGRNTDDQFGSAVVLSSDGRILVVSEPTYDGPNGDRSGNVRCFVFSPMNRYDTMGQELFGQAATDHFGISLSLSGNGQRLAVGAPYHDNGGTSRNVSGNVRVFHFNQQKNEWDPLGSALEGSSHLDWFGWGVDLSYDGNVLAVGAPRNLEHGGYVRCFQLNDVNGGVTQQWQRLGSKDIYNEIAPTRYDDSFGHVVALSTTKTKNNVETFRLAIGSPGKNAGALNSGLAAVYELQDNNQWDLVGSAVGPSTPGAGHQFGYSLDLNDNILAVGMPGWEDNLGQVSLYQLSTSEGNDDYDDWRLHPTFDQTQLQGIDESDFGFAVRLVSASNAAKPSWTVAVGSAVTSGGGGDDFAGRVNIFQVS